MKISGKYIIILTTLLIIASGCRQKEIFKVVNGPEFPWKTLSSLELAANAPYYNISYDSWSNPLGESNFYDFAASDISKLVPGITGNVPWLEYSSRKYRETATTQSTRLYGIFNVLYKVITSCNDPLNYLAQAEQSGQQLFPESSQAEIDAVVPRIKAELYFFRGFSYYYLVQLFCPPYDPNGANDTKILPLKNSFSYDPDSIRTTKIGTTKEIYDQIISDLTTAKKLMPLSYQEEGKVNYYAICGILARVYFMMGDYDDALAECSEVIDKGPYSLPSNVDPIESWNKSPGETPAPEVIWEFVPNENGNMEAVETSITKVAPWGAINGGRGADWVQCSWVQFVLNDWVLKKIGWMKDPQHGDYTETAEAKADKRYGQTWLRLEAYIPKPDNMDQIYYENHYQTLFTDVPFPMVFCDKFYRGKRCDVTKQPLLRLAELLLTRSIIRFEKGDRNGAAEDVNKVRVRAGLAPIAPGDLTADIIDNERIKEMGAEDGDRLRYLISLRRPIGLGDRTGMSPINPPYENMYWKIPEEEIDLNGGYPPDFHQ